MVDLYISGEDGATYFWPPVTGGCEDLFSQAEVPHSRPWRGLCQDPHGIQVGRKDLASFSGSFVYVSFCY